MVILVTGAGGFLGTAVVSSLRSVGGTVIGVRRSAADEESTVACDLADPDALGRLLAETGPHAVVNLAAVVNFSAGSLPALYPVNTLCPALIAAWCARHDAYLVQASSVAVHGEPAGILRLGAPVAPATEYGKSKWLADEAIAASGCRSAVIRFGGIFGRAGPRHLGLNRAIDDARAGQPPTIVGAGTGKRNYIHVDDAAAAIRACVANRTTGVLYAGGEIRSMREMLQDICDVWLPGQVPLNRPGNEAADHIVDVSAELPSPASFRESLERCR